MFQVCHVLWGILEMRQGGWERKVCFKPSCSWLASFVFFLVVGELIRKLKKKKVDLPFSFGMGIFLFYPWHTLIMLEEKPNF